MRVALLPEVHNHFFGLLGIEQQVADVTLLSQVVHLIVGGHRCLMRPITVVSSANLIMVLELCIGLQS